MFIGKTYATMTRLERIQWIKPTVNTTLDILFTIRNYVRAPVYGIQYTREAMNIETVEELANFYQTRKMEEAVRTYVIKYTMMCQYVPLIQLRIPSVYFIRCGLRQPLVQIKTYLQRLIEQCFTGKVETELVDCDVRSFLEGNNGYQVATIMNENLLRQFQIIQYQGELQGHLFSLFINEILFFY